MSATVSPTLADVYGAIRAFIIGVIGNYPVIQGLQNRTAMPAGPFVLMQAIGWQRLEWNIDDDTDGGLVVPPAPQITSSLQATRVDVQIDCYGPDSNSWATMLGTLIRDEYACDALAPVCQPLFSDEARMIPLTTAEAQYLERWSLTAAFQYNPVTVTPQSFAVTLDVVPINVDVEFPP